MRLLNISTGIWNFNWSFNFVDLIDWIQIRTKSSVHTDNFIVNYGEDGEGVEAVSEEFPQLDVIPIGMISKDSLITSFCTRRRTRRVCWWCCTRGCPWGWRSSQGTLSCRPATGRSSRSRTSLGPRSLLKTGSSRPAGIHPVRTDGSSRSTVRGCPLNILKPSYTGESRKIPN